jgi:hypothetical protein
MQRDEDIVAQIIHIKHVRLKSQLCQKGAGRRSRSLSSNLSRRRCLGRDRLRSVAGAGRLDISLMLSAINICQMGAEVGGCC